MALPNTPFGIAQAIRQIYLDSGKETKDYTTKFYPMGSITSRKISKIQNSTISARSWQHLRP